MPTQGSNQTLFAKGLERYQDATTIFYARPTDLNNHEQVKDFVRFAYQYPSGADVIIASDESHALASFGQQLRPDVHWIANSSNAGFIGGGERRSPAQTAVAAIREMSEIKSGSGVANVSRPLSASDARWVSRLVGVDAQPGLVVTAPFDPEGNLDRASFASQFSRHPTETVAHLRNKVSMFADAQTTLRHWPIAVDSRTRWGSIRRLNPRSIRHALSHPASRSTTRCSAKPLSSGQEGWGCPQLSNSAARST
jgi:hypothetical protein